jgi:hypothetical protein
MLYVGYYYIERERERDKYVCGAKNLLGLNLKGVKPPTPVQKLAIGKRVGSRRDLTND